MVNVLPQYHFIPQQSHKKTTAGSGERSKARDCPQCAAAVKVFTRNKTITFLLIRRIVHEILLSSPNSKDESQHTSDHTDNSCKRIFFFPAETAENSEKRGIASDNKRPRQCRHAALLHRLQRLEQSKILQYRRRCPKSGDDQCPPMKNPGTETGLAKNHFSTGNQKITDATPQKQGRSKHSGFARCRRQQQRTGE